MRMKMPLLAGVLCLAAATPAYACGFWFTSAYMPIPARPSFGIGVNGALSDPAYWGISGDLAMKLGEKAVVRPAIGVCTGNGETDPFFGAGVAFNLTQSASMSLNLQSGIAYESFDGGSEMTIPIGAAASFKGSGSMGFYAGASLWWRQVEFQDQTASDSDPVLFGGIMANAGSMAWTLGGQLFMGDDTEFGIVAGLSMNKGASAIRHVGKLLKK